MRRPVRELMLGLCAALAAAMLQVRFHLIPLDQGWYAWLSNGAGWALLLVVLYLLFHLWRAPWQLDRARYREIQGMREQLQLASKALLSFKQGCLAERVSGEAEQLRQYVLNHQTQLAAFPHPLDQSLINQSVSAEQVMYHVQLAYSSHRDNTCSALSGSDARSDVAKYANPHFMDLRQIGEMLEANRNTLRDYAAKFLTELSDKLKISG